MNLLKKRANMGALHKKLKKPHTSGNRVEFREC